MTRIRIEGLLTAFPKLMGSDSKQHTYIETESVRWVTEILVHLLVSILMLFFLLVDMSINLWTLYICYLLPIVQVILLKIWKHCACCRRVSIVFCTYSNSDLFSYTSKHIIVVPDIAGAANNLGEEKVLDKVYELIFAFDEVITAGGYRENINIQQIRTNMEMESHEEKLHNMIKASKMESAKEQANNAARAIKQQKMSNMMEGMGSSATGHGGYSNDSMESEEVAAAVQASINLELERAKAAPTVPSAPIKGMSILAKGEAKNNSLFDALVKEEKLAPIIAKTSNQPAAVDAVASSGVVVHPITLQAVEKISATITRDGDVSNVEVKGSLTLTAADDEVACCVIQMNVPSSTNAFTFNTHPKVNKTLYDQSNVLIMKDTNKGFPSGRPVSILRWSNAHSSGDLIPITVNCWPEEESKNKMLVTIDYSASTKIELHQVKIAIPIQSAELPNIRTIDGQYQMNRTTNELIWEIDMIDSSNSSGNLEFTIAEKDMDSFFPINVSFTSSSMYCNMDVASVKTLPVGGGVSSATSNIMYGYSKAMVTEEYIIE